MRYKLTFVTGFAAGYVLGAKAGRERYEAIARAARAFWENPAVQEAAGVLQAQAAGVIDNAKRTVTGGVMSKIGGSEVRHRATEPYPASAGVNGATPG